MGLLTVMEELIMEAREAVYNADITPEAREDLLRELDSGLLRAFKAALERIK